MSAQTPQPVVPGIDSPGKSGSLLSPRFVQLALIPAAFAVGLSLGYVVWGRQQPSQPTPQATQSPEAQRFDVAGDDDPALGPTNAPILLIEFSDFSCPYCRKWHEETFPALMAAYPDKIRFVYRDLPVVGGGAVGLLAAQAANCAGDQGSYWEFHDAIFSGKYGLSREAYVQYASELGLDTDALGECLDTKHYEQEVLGDRDYAFGLGVTSTPTFFINGIPVVGARPLEVFKLVIDNELATNPGGDGS